jgi:hypothetical protein
MTPTRKLIRDILRGVYELVLASDSVRMSEEFIHCGKDNGTVFLYGVGGENRIRLSFATEGNTVMLILSGRAINSRLIPRMVITADDSTPGALAARMAELRALIGHVHHFMAILESGRQPGE